jgi:hypothetical protein
MALQEYQEHRARPANHRIAAGAAALMRPGTELCHREDAERLYCELPDR